VERINESQKDYRKGSSGPKYLFRGPKIDWGVLRLEPGESMGAHSHKEVEETFYFFDGSPKMVINDEVFQTREGDAFRVEPREKHDVVNDTDRAVKVVFIKSPYLPEDKIDYQRA